MVLHSCRRALIFFKSRTKLFEGSAKKSNREFESECFISQFCMLQFTKSDNQIKLEINIFIARDKSPSLTKKFLLFLWRFYRYPTFCVLKASRGRGREGKKEIGREGESTKMFSCWRKLFFKTTFDRQRVFHIKRFNGNNQLYFLKSVM